MVIAMTERTNDMIVIIVAVVFLVTVLLLCVLGGGSGGESIATTEQAVSATYSEAESETTEPYIEIGTIEEADVTGTPAPFIDELIAACTSDVR